VIGLDDSNEVFHPGDGKAIDGLRLVEYSRHIGRTQQTDIELILQDRGS
jgi:hypothetical protein